MIREMKRRESKCMGKGEGRQKGITVRNCNFIYESSGGGEVRCELPPGILLQREWTFLQRFFLYSVPNLESSYSQNTLNTRGWRNPKIHADQRPEPLPIPSDSCCHPTRTLADAHKSSVRHTCCHAPYFRLPLPVLPVHHRTRRFSNMLPHSRRFLFIGWRVGEDKEGFARRAEPSNHIRAGHEDNRPLPSY